MPIINNFAKLVLTLNFLGEKFKKWVKFEKNKLASKDRFMVVYSVGLNIGKIARDVNENNPKVPIKKHNLSNWVNKDCQEWGVIYYAECQRCCNEGKFSLYIGETSQNLKDRINEHMKQVKKVDSMDFCGSAIGIHLLNQHGK